MNFLKDVVRTTMVIMVGGGEKHKKAVGGQLGTIPWNLQSCKLLLTTNKQCLDQKNKKTQTKSDILFDFLARFKVTAPHTQHRPNPGAQELGSGALPATWLAANTKV